jgi:hypothetical protein
LILALAVCAGSGAGCGDDTSSNADARRADAGPDSATTTDATPAETPEEFFAEAGGGWKTLVTGRWDMAAGKEAYRCVRFTLPKDVYVGSFRALSPLGTHHTVLTVAEEAGEPDGITTCSAQTNAARNITGSGVGTNDFTLPEGVAVHLRAGQQLLLNLHLFNVSDAPLSGLSGTLIKVVAEKDVKQTAEGLLAGPLNLDIPVGGPTVQTGECTLKTDGTLFAVLPHMHQLGVHLKAIAKSSIQGDVVLHDGDYSFDEQVVYPFSEVKMKAGDKVQVECTYQNTTKKAVKFGDSSLAEMCFAGLYRYPADTGSFLCTQ